MKNFIPILKDTKLFAGVTEHEIYLMLNCMQAQKSQYSKGEYIFHQGDCMKYISILAEGSVYIQNDDYWGNRSIINAIGAGEMFGEAYIGTETDTFMNDVVAAEDCTVILFDANKILETCSFSCHFHNMVIRNLFLAVSEKNKKLIQKLSYLSKRSTREKLISYLSEQAKKHNSNSFAIQFNRQQLADYLSVDRSAMSNELCKLRDEGLIAFEKNRFILF